jgi:phosphatidylserine/phosphatidylglycerophosphate/cardiolipin synthase-like enzyme
MCRRPGFRRLEVIVVRRFLGLPLLAALLTAGIPVPRAAGQSVTATGAVSVYFTPGDRSGDAVVRAFDGAHREILAAIYEFTLSDVARALIGARARHVDVWLIMDESATRDRGSQYYRLTQALGSHLRARAGVNGASGIVHDKFAVVDGVRVLTGSFNWTYSAEHSNWENLVVIDSPVLAGAYASEFHRMWQAP